MIIQLKKISESHISLHIPIQSDIDSINMWKKRIVTNILLLAYLNKPATLITVDPDRKSVGQEFPNEKVFINKKNFLVNCLSTCKNTDLIKLGESYDLELGLLAVTSLSCKNISTCDLIKFFPKDEDDQLLIKEQLFYCSDDGYMIYWLNFQFPFEELLLNIRNRMSFYKIDIIKL
jgi:hypothetical protein